MHQIKNAFLCQSSARTLSAAGEGMFHHSFAQINLEDIFFFASHEHQLTYYSWLFCFFLSWIFPKQVYKYPSKFSQVPFSTQCSFVFASFSSCSCWCVRPVQWHFSVHPWQQWLNNSAGKVSESVSLPVAIIIRWFRLGVQGHVYICSSSSQVSTTVDTRLDHFFDCFSLSLFCCE